MHDVVITGLGVVSGLGHDVTRFAEALHSTKTAIRSAPWTSDEGPVWWAGVRDFEVSEWAGPHVEAGSDVSALFALAAAEQAVDQAGGGVDVLRTAVVHGTTFGGANSLMRAQHALDRDGPTAVDRAVVLKASANTSAARLAMRFGLHGQQLTISTTCASSLDAIGTAARLIAGGHTDAALAGGTEGGWADACGVDKDDFVPVLEHGKIRCGLTVPGATPGTASTPFDVRRRGAVTGDGSVMVMLERAEHARRRGATVLAEIVGYSSLADAYHLAAPQPRGRWEAETMRQALCDAHLDAGDVDALVAHATASVRGDSAEIRAVNTVFRGTGPVVTSLKGHLGHTGAASGAMGLIAAVDAVHRGRLPHTANTRLLDPEIDFDVVLDRSRELDTTTVMLNAFGFGGQNASLIVQRPLR